MKLTNRKLVTGVGALLLGLTSVHTQAAPFAFWSTDGWTAMNVSPANEDGQVGPGGGGQAFDAEYLYFKQSGNTLSIGLQAGFNLITGYVYTSPQPLHYYAGDLALSFDGSTSTYEYGIDFGLLTKDYQLDKVDMGSGTGIDPAGFYSVSQWNTDVYSGHAIANPFAIDGGSLVSNLSLNAAGSGTPAGSPSGCSYWRTSLGLTTDSTLHAHWTMNCGNDFIRGSTTLTGVPVPEPSAFALMMLSLMGMGWAGSKRLKSRRTTA